jgi:BASS family bile acid:Na+ symporter
MPFILNTALPLLVIFAMTVVGLELTPADFGNVRRYPGVMAAVLIGQWIALPLAAILVVHALSLPPAFAVGLLLVAAAPIAALSNYYAMLARARLALAVTLTAVSSVAATVTMPLIATVSVELLQLETMNFELPAAKLLQQTAIGLLLPIAAGMTIRRFASRWVERRGQLLRALSLVALAAIVGFIVVDQMALIRAQMTALVAGALLYTSLALAIGFVFSRAAARSRDGVGALLFGFPAHNISIAILVAVAALGRTDIASFGAVLFLVQAAVLVPLAMAFSARRPLVVLGERVE